MSSSLLFSVVFSNISRNSTRKEILLYLVSFNALRSQLIRVSRKLRPRKLRPQTRKTQTLGCLENSDLEKTQTLGCLENSDSKNSDPWMSRKLRPENLRPSGCLENSDPKNKTYYTAGMPQVDLF